MAEKILIVDDDIDSLKLIGLMLQRHGYEVLAANSGVQGLSKADVENPDLIILDVMMPDMNGLEVSRRLRTNDKTAKIPIIMFTAKTLIDDKVKGFEAGADDYLTKPTHPAELASRVKAILTRGKEDGASSGEPATQAAPVAKQRGRVIGVLGAKGGVGTTTVAINIAASIAQRGNEQPIVADLALGRGSMGLLLGFGQSQGMARLLARSQKEVNKQSVEAELINHQSKMRLLLSSSRPREAQINAQPETTQALVKTLRELTRTSIIDLGHGLDANVSGLLAQLDKIVIVVEPTNIALSMARELIRELDANNAGSKINVVVVSRSQTNLQTPWHEIEAALGREVRAMISPAPELAFQSMENAVPMVSLQPGAIVSGQFVKLAEALSSRINPLSGA
jgi:CheY-like chemotaxis protein/MinD-like ATPase involved in chromosome partitioning or flagellar assembly